MAGRRSRRSGRRSSAACSRFDDHWLVCRPDFPDRHAWLVVETLAIHGGLALGGSPPDPARSPVPLHPGALAFLRGAPLPAPVGCRDGAAGALSIPPDFRPKSDGWYAASTRATGHTSGQRTSSSERLQDRQRPTGDGDSSRAPPERRRVRPSFIQAPRQSAAVPTGLGVSGFDFLLLPTHRPLPALGFAPGLAFLLPLRRALAAFLLSLRAGLNHRSRHGIHPFTTVFVVFDHPS